MTTSSVFKSRPWAASIPAILFLAILSVPAAETVNLFPSKTSAVAIGEEVTVTLNLADGTAFNGFQGYLEWDKAILELVKAPTTGLKDSNDEAFSAAPGFVLADARAAGSGKRGFFTTAGNITPTANTVLMTWTFKGLANGTAQLRTRQASNGEDYTKLSNQSGTTRYPAVGPQITIGVGASTPTRKITLKPLPGPIWWQTELPFTAENPSAGTQIIVGPIGQSARLFPAAANTFPPDSVN